MRSAWFPAFLVLATGCEARPEDPAQTANLRVESGFGFHVANRPDGIWEWEFSAPFEGEPTSTAPRRILDGEWTVIAAGWQHACAIDSTGSLRCWGRYLIGDQQAFDVVEDGEWIAVETGVTRTCGIQRNGTLWCWVAAEDSARVQVPGDWMQVGVSDLGVCAIRRDATLWCGHADWEEVPATLPDRVGHESPRLAEWAAIASASAFHCGLRSDDAWCSAENHTPPSTRIEGRWHSIAARVDKACALDHAGEMTCWSIGPEPLFSSGPPGPWEHIGDSRYVEQCGVKRDGSVWCWGPGVAPRELTFD